MKDMSRRFISRLLVAMSVLLCLTGLTACSGKQDNDFSIVGEWIIDSYVHDGEIMLPDDLGEYIGTDSAPIYNNRKFIFFDDGTYVMRWTYDLHGTTDEFYGNYAMADSMLKLSNDEGEYVLLNIQDGLILQDETERIGLVSRYRKK